MAELPDGVVMALLCLRGALVLYGAYLAVNEWLADRLEWRRQREAMRKRDEEVRRG